MLARFAHTLTQEDDRKSALAACVEASVIVVPLAGNEQLMADILAALGDALDEAQLKEKVVIGVTVATTWAKTIPFKTADGELIPFTEQVAHCSSIMQAKRVPCWRACGRTGTRWPSTTRLQLRTSRFVSLCRGSKFAQRCVGCAEQIPLTARFDEHSVSCVRREARTDHT
jgi:hypothetical protein